MLVLFETPAGYSLFKVSDEKKLNKTDSNDMHEQFFADSSSATSFLNLVSFQPFSDTADAVTAATSCIEGKVSKSLKSFLKKQIGKDSGSKKSSKSGGGGESLAIADKNLAISIKEQLPSLRCNLVYDDKTQELFRGIRYHMEDLMENGGNAKHSISASDLRAMQLGLSHSLSRYKLKFSADKVDTMVIQAVGLLDELDKEINTYAMRVKEWYGWHFPEMQSILNDNAQYAGVVLECGYRTEFKQANLSSIIEDETVEQALKEAAEVSMGTEISEMDVINIKSLAEQVLSMMEYRSQLFEYLKNRMNAIAPNLTILVGELVGARLISHAGSLMNLAKQPASTVQILGAEKALFRALKTKHDTPKYGLIYHASLIGQAQPKHKGKISRVLAAKAALATRVDALSDGTSGQETDTTIGYESRSKVEARLRQLQGGASVLDTATTNNTKGALTSTKTMRYNPTEAKASSNGKEYNESSDLVDVDMDMGGFQTPKKKDKKDKKKKDKKRKSDVGSDTNNDDSPTKKSSKRKASEIENKNNTEEEDKVEKSAKKSSKKSKKSRKSKD